MEVQSVMCALTPLLSLVACCATDPAPNTGVSAASPVTAAPALTAPVASASAGAAIPALPSDVRPSLFEDGGNAAPLGSTSERDDPLPLRRRMPSGTLGRKADDVTVRAALAAFCSERERDFKTRARTVPVARQNGPLATAGNACTCDATLRTERFVSVACTDDLDLGDGHPTTTYQGFTFALDAGAARRVAFAEVCAPVAACTDKLAVLVADAAADADFAPEASADVRAYLADPIFVLRPGAVRLEIAQTFAQGAGHGSAIDIAPSALGALYRLVDGP